LADKSQADAVISFAVELFQLGFKVRADAKSLQVASSEQY
jgi:hypothetical protein